MELLGLDKRESIFKHDHPTKYFQADSEIVKLQRVHGSILAVTIVRLESDRSLLDTYQGVNQG